MVQVAIDEVGIPFDPEFAKAQLAEAGYPNCEGFPQVTLLGYSGQSTLNWIEFAQANWSEVLGCDPSLIKIEQQSFRELLAATLRVAATVPADLWLSLADRPSAGWRPPVNVPVEVQTTGDLGKRLNASFTTRFEEGYDRVVIIGSDCPELGSEHLHQAFRRLKDRPVVLGPAADGGYWLIGQRSPGGIDLSDLPWSSAITLEATRQRLRDLAQPWSELPELRDVDTVADLEWAMTYPGGFGDLAARLRAAVRSDRGGPQ